MDFMIDSLVATAMFQCYKVAKDNKEEKTAAYIGEYIGQLGYAIWNKDGKFIMTKEKED